MNVSQDRGDHCCGMGKLDIYELAWDLELGNIVGDGKHGKLFNQGLGYK